MSDARYQLLRASAGTGKTHRLVEAYAHEVLEAGRRPSEVVAITFTRKAAAELRARIKGRLSGAGVGLEVLSDLSRAPINNFHGLALQLLTSAGELLDGVQVLGDTGDDRLLFFDACEEAWFAEGTAVAADVQALAQFFEVDRKLPGELWNVIGRAREDGAAISGAQLLGAYDPQALRARCAPQLEALVQRLEAAVGGQTEAGREKLRAFLAARPKQAMAPEAWAEAWSRAAQGLKRQGRLAEVISEEEAKFLRQELVQQMRAESLAQALAPSLARLLDHGFSRYVEMKEERRALDFGDLVERAVGMLERDAARHAEVCARVRAVLVDEAQDTNSLQYRFVELLCGTQGPAAGSSPPASRYVVGDRKQAIYTFRGANPKSFDSFAADVLDRGGEDVSLDTSYRSCPELVAGINHLGPHLFGERYEPLLALPAAQGEAGAPLGRPAMTWLELPDSPNASGAIMAEAAAAATWVRDRIEAGTSPSDVTLLLSAMSNATFFASAMAAAGVPAVLGGGGGLYEQVEIIDVANLLAWLTDGRNRLAAAVVLRSPIVGASDNALLTLLGRSREDGGLTLLRRGQLDTSRLTLEVDRQALGRFNDVMPSLLAAARAMSAHELLRYADERLDLRAAYLALPGGEQRLANLDRLVQLAEEAERKVQGGVARFAREQLRRIEQGHAEPVMPVPVDGRGAVTITTVHQSKGLEFPVVLLADLAHGTRLDTGSLRYHRDRGVVFRPAQRGQPQRTERWQEVGDDIRADADAELQRLLYVAVTRARREVVFVHARTERARPTGFSRLLQPWRPQAVEAGVLEVREAQPAPARAPEAPPEAPRKADLIWAEALLAQARPQRASPGTRFVLPVTELESYVQCLRRGALVHQLGLREENIQSRRRAQELQGEDPIDPLARGRLAHAVLAAMDRHVAPARRFIDGELLAAGYDPTDPRLADLVLDLEAFLGSQLGQELVRLGAARRRHELPFQIAFEASPYTAVVHGQMDLVYWDDEGPVVVDFKHAKSSGPGLAAYATQLAAYATALASLTGDPGPVRTRLVFLKDHTRPPLNRLVTLEMRAELEREVVAVVQGLGAAQAQAGVVPGRPKSRCMQLDCGFVERCHGKAKGAGQGQLDFGVARH